MESSLFVVTSCVDSTDPTRSYLSTFDGAVHGVAMTPTGPQSIGTIRAAADGRPVSVMLAVGGYLWCGSADSDVLHVYTSPGMRPSHRHRLGAPCHRMAVMDGEVVAITRPGSMVCFNQHTLEKVSERKNTLTPLTNVLYVGVSHTELLWTLHSGCEVHPGHPVYQRSWAEVGEGSTQPPYVRALQQRCTAQTETIYELERRLEGTWRGSKVDVLHATASLVQHRKVAERCLLDLHASGLATLRASWDVTAALHTDAQAAFTLLRETQGSVTLLTEIVSHNDREITRLETKLRTPDRLGPTTVSKPSTPDNSFVDLLGSMDVSHVATSRNQRAASLEGGHELGAKVQHLEAVVRSLSRAGGGGMAGPRDLVQFDW